MNANNYIRALKVFKTLIFSPIYIPHLLFLLFNVKGCRDFVKKDMKRRCDKYWGGGHFLYYLHNDEYFRTLYYHRIGLYAKSVVSWYRPGAKTFVIAPEMEIGGGFMGYHPYATIINGKKIGENFTCLQCTTLGVKDEHSEKFCTIGDNVYLGANVSVIGPVHIGNNVIVGAGSVVVKDVPDDTVVAGVPARVIKNI